MVLNMNEARLTTIEPLLSAGTSIGFSAAGDAGERYEHLCRFLKLKPFAGRGRKKRERGVLLRYRR